MINSEFEALGPVLEQTLNRCSGRENSLHRYGGSPSQPTSGFRVVVPLGSWSAGFFLWRRPVSRRNIRNVLEVRIQLPGVSDMVFPLAFVLKELEVLQTEPCCYHEIESAQALESDLHGLWVLLLRYRDAIDELAKAPQQLRERQQTAISAYLKTDISRLEDAGERKTLLREWYFSQALPKEDGEPEPEPVKKAPQPAPTRKSPAACNSRPADAFIPGIQREKPASRQKTKNPFWDMLLGALVLLPFWVVFYLLLYLINSDYSSRGMVLVIGTDWLEVLACGWITAFAMTFVMPRSIVWLLRKHDPDVKERLNAVAPYLTKKAQRCFAALLALAVTACTVHLFFYGFSGLAFAENGFYDRSSLFPIGGVYHPYSSVSRCTSAESSMAMLGQSLSYNDYVLILKDGTTYHLSTDYGASDRQVEEIIIPLVEGASED